MIVVGAYKMGRKEFTGCWTGRHLRIPKHTQALSGEPAAPSDSAKPGLDNESKSLGVYKMERKREKASC